MGDGLKASASKIAALLSPGRWASYQRGSFVRAQVEPLGVDPGDELEMLAPEPDPMPGIDLRDRAQVERIRGWIERGPGLPQVLRNDPALSLVEAQARVANPFYQTPDAEVYGSILLDERPRRIVEVGAGFSTRIARHAITHGGLDSHLVVIDPEPRTDIAAAADEVLRSRVEVTALDTLALASGDVLFIDSSHVLRTGGDLPFLYNELLPTLPDGVLVHVHDIFLPYPLAPYWSSKLWTEQYLLQAVLAHSPRYQVEFATHYASRVHLDLMREAFGPLVGTTPALNGQSFWFRVVGSA